MRIQDMLAAAGVGLDEVKGRLATYRPIYCRRTLAASAIAAGALQKHLHAGEGDAATDLGYASGTIDGTHTNLQKSGRVPKDELFIALGLGLELPRGIAAADFDALCGNNSSVEVLYQEKSGKVNLPLCMASDLPALQRSVYDVEQDTQSAGAAAFRENFARVGKPYVFDRPLFVIRGGAEDHDGNQVIFKHHAGWTPSASTIYTLKVYGVWFQMHAQLPKGVKGFNA